MNRIIRRVPRTIRRLARDQSGAAAIEYSVICATMALVLVASLKGLGPAMNDAFATLSRALESAR